MFKVKNPHTNELEARGGSGRTWHGKEEIQKDFTFRRRAICLVTCKKIESTVTERLSQSNHSVKLLGAEVKQFVMRKEKNDANANKGTDTKIKSDYLSTLNPDVREIRTGKRCGGDKEKKICRGRSRVRR